MRFTLPAAGTCRTGSRVSHGVFQLLGRRVYTISQYALADGPGLCRFARDATGQPAGIYFFRIDSAAARAEVGVLALQD